MQRNPRRNLQFFRQSPRAGWATFSGVISGVLLGIVAYAPASWLATGIDIATAGRVQLVDPVGRIWNGSAALELTGGAGSISALSLPSRIEWQLQLHWGSVRAAVTASCCTNQPVVAYLMPHRTRVEAGDVALPMAWLQGLGAPWNTLRLRGDLRASWEPLQWAWNAPLHTLQGHVNVHAHQVATSLSTLPQLGSYRLQLSGGESPQLSLSTVDGALSLVGHGQLHATGWRFEGQAQAAPAQSMELASLLTLLGRRDGNTTMIRWG